MKIHLYARDFPPRGENLNDGVFKAVHGLAGGMVKNQADVTVLCAGTEDSVFLTQAGYTIRCFEAGNPKFRWGLGLPSGLRRYVAENEGVYVLNGVFSPSVYGMSRACLESGRPYVCWPHEPHHPALFEKRRMAKWAYFRLRDRPMFRAAAAIQVFDSNQVNFLNELGVLTPTIEMVNGFDAADVLPSSELSWRLEGPPRLLFFGSIDADHKGLDLLLDAFGAIVDLTDANLVLQGPDFGDLAALKQRADHLHLSDKRVEFREPVYGRSTRTIAEHDVFLLPSRRDAFPLAAIEAMVAARMMLVTEVSGITPHVRAAGCGFVVEPNVDSVRRGLLRTLEAREQWKEMGLAGREYALANFNWEHIAADVLSRYERF